MRIPTVLLTSLLVAGALGALPTAAAANTCQTADPVAPHDTRVGVVPAGTSHFYKHLVYGEATYVLKPNAGSDVDLYVWASDCSYVSCWSEEEGSAQDSCTVDSESNYVVEVYGYSGAGGYTITFNGEPISTCNNGQDDDGDGNYDYPDDAGCSSLADATETGDCDPILTDVVVCLQAGRVILEEPVYLVGVVGGDDRIVGYLDTYHFTFFGVGANVPCVTLLVGGVEHSPCRDAGGAFVSRGPTLVDQAEPEVVPSGPVVTVRVCEAELTATALGFGVTSAPAYTVC